MFNDEKTTDMKTCKSCSIKFEITSKDLEFYDKISPTFNGKKYLIPSPTFCPDCRQQRRLSFRNERKLYKRKCDFSGKDIISIYSPDKDFKVYEQSIWWSDNWNPLDYGKEFDFSKTFFEQFDTLMKITPKINILNWESENSEYTNQSTNNKDCYFLTSSGFSEKSAYSHWLKSCENCFDCLQTKNSSNCYYGVNINKCYKSYYIENSENIENSLFLFDCKNSINCVACVGLRGKKNYFLNREVTDEEIKKVKLEINNSKDFRKDILEKYYKLKSSFYRKYIFGELNENVSGDYINDSRESFNCYNCNEIEKLCFSFDSLICNNSYDLTEVYKVDYGYENHGGNRISKSCFCSNFDNYVDSFYSFFGTNISNCFGCIGLKNQEYCILNKKYSKEEYEILVPKIIEHMQKTGEWGEFFPSSISPFGYNETVANEYFPLDKNKALENGFKWSEYETPFPKLSKIIKASMLPDNISKIPDDILNWAIECEVSGKPFRIIKQELDFYRKHELPIPKKHPNERHLERMALRNPRKLFDRNCDKCGSKIKTTYSPDRKEVVYCESCYEKEVY